MPRGTGKVAELTLALQQRDQIRAAEPRVEDLLEGVDHRVLKARVGKVLLRGAVDDGVRLGVSQLDVCRAGEMISTAQCKNIIPLTA